MHIKFLSHDRGSGRAAIAYLMGEKDSQGKVRAGVQVLRGNPEQIGHLIDSLKFVSRYSSVVIAFHKNDDPSDSEIDEVLNEFERVAFPGLLANQYAWSAVLHIESDGSKHIHGIAPRVELTTGKSMNIAPPGWQKRYDPLRDAFNYEKGWARPDDPRLSRVCQPGEIAKFDSWKSGADARQQITEWLTTLIANGDINDRQDVLNSISKIGEINRQSKDYISIRLDGEKKPVRLKGPIYDEEFDGRSVREAAAAAQRRPAGRERPDRVAAEAARAELAEALQRVAEYNKKRYPATTPILTGAPRGDVQTPQVDDALASADHHLPGVAHRVSDGPVELVEAEPGGRPGAPEGQSDPEVGGRVLPESSWPASLQEGGVTDDRIGEIAHRAIEQAQRSARAAIQALERCAGAASEAYRSVVSACRAADKAAPGLKKKMDAELERFKAEISLTDFAQAEFGYELLKKESSAASKVLSSADDKIIVTRQLDGHDVYFSTADDRDCGSIIDFLQARAALTLGQVRKVLRRWLPGSHKPAPRMPQCAPERAAATPKDRGDVLQRWARMRPYSSSYLTRDRGLDPRVIEAFGVRQDEHGNACIAHRDEIGVVGWESKNKGFTGFAAGGERNVSFTRLDNEQIKKLVITEAAIDVMSWAQLKHEPGTAYMSTAGTQLNQAQRDQLQQIMEKTGAVVVLAMDADEAGEKMAGELAKLAPQSATVTRDLPPAGKDWNAALLLLQQPSQIDPLQNPR